MTLDYDQIAEIVKIIDGSSCDELIVETGDLKLVVRRNGAVPVATQASDRTIAKTPSAVPSSATRETPASAKRVELSAGQSEVIAPMVGTFYRASSPDAPAFVEVGGEVIVGQPLCIIEVMKLFTTINSSVAGRIVQIGAENGELVEYGRTLFVIEASGE